MKSRGISLVEVLAALAVASVLLSFAIPAFSGFIAEQRTIAAVNQIIGAVNSARHAAIILRVTTTLCPAHDAVCSGSNQWHLGAMIFKDPNANGVREPQEPILARLPALRPGEHFYWRSFRNRSYLQFEATGITAWQNGSFQYCPAGDDPRYSKSLIVNAQGRITKSRDADGDGIDEDAGGRPLRCA